MIYVIAFLLTMALSRYRELAADRSGAILIGKPSVLASALVHVTGDMGKIPRTDLRKSEGMNAFFFAPALAGNTAASLFSTHPSLGEATRRAEEARSRTQRLVGLRDTLFGRTKQVAPKLDGLFALPSAALTLQSELDLVSSGNAGLCFKAGSGETTITTDDEIIATPQLRDETGTVKVTTDDLGFKWLVVTDPELDGLVTRIHGANTTMVEHGLGPRLLCAVFGFVPKTPPGDGSVRMVYLLKQGTFYPFAPTGPDQRDNELELRVRSFLGDDLPIEKDLSRWMALWDLPVS